MCEKKKSTPVPLVLLVKRMGLRPHVVDTITALAGNDSVDARGGDDTVYLDAGNDAAYAGAGNDTVYGGDGSDTLSWLVAANETRYECERWAA